VGASKTMLVALFDFRWVTLAVGMLKQSQAGGAQHSSGSGAAGDHGEHCHFDRNRQARVAV
jgi:hypothetical protein